MTAAATIDPRSLDAEALYRGLVDGVRSLLKPDAVLVGIWSGGAWLAERLQKDLGLAGSPGVLSSVLHRDDFSQRGLSAGVDADRSSPSPCRTAPSCSSTTCSTPAARSAPRSTSCSTYGRPASVALAVLVDRGGRELPIEAAVRSRARALEASQRLRLARDDAGRFSFELH